MAKGEYLGMGVVAIVGVGKYTGSQRQGLFLAEYDESNDSYTGISFLQNEKASDNQSAVIRVPGLKRYPTGRADDPFQFVLPGEDITPLQKIAAESADTYTRPSEVVVEEDAASEAAPAGIDTRPDWQKLGFASKEEWRAAGKPKA